VFSLIPKPFQPKPFAGNSAALRYAQQRRRSVVK
jgi:hypothetical protein